MLTELAQREETTERGGDEASRGTAAGLATPAKRGTARRQRDWEGMAGLGGTRDTAA